MRYQLNNKLRPHNFGEWSSYDISLVKEVVEKNDLAMTKAAGNLYVYMYQLKGEEYDQIVDQIQTCLERKSAA